MTSTDDDGKAQAKEDFSNHPLAHPEVLPIFSSVLDTLIRESDRGAVLIGASVVDSYLGKLFEHVAAGWMGPKDVKRLLRYPGALSTFAAKADVALATRLIGPQTYQSLQILRALRNDVAHSPDTFRLADHRDRLHYLYDLGPGVAAYVNRSANQLTLDSFFSRLTAMEADKPEGERAFRTKEDVIEYLRKPSSALETLQEKAFRLEVGIAVALLCATLVLRWEFLEKTLQRNEHVINADPPA
ncbi:MAG: hypothetical protein ACREOQ_17825 [Gemmatimonadales bacterium]